MYHSNTSLTRASISFSPELEWEEVEWNVDRTSEKTGLEPVEVPCDAPFTLYDLTQTWK